MSIDRPGIDTRHIIQMAMKAKTLKTLSKEEDEFQAKQSGVNNIIHLFDYKTPFQKPVYTKDTIKEIKEYCKDKTPDEILDAMGIKVSYDYNGDKRLSHYGWPGNAYSFETAGIDENALLKDVKHITYYCDLTGSGLKNLGKVETIGGALFIPYFSKLEDLSSVKYVGTVDSNAESAEDISELFKRLNFHPQTIRQTTGYKYPIGIIVTSFVSGL